MLNEDKASPNIVLNSLQFITHDEALSHRPKIMYSFQTVRQYVSTQKLCGKKNASNLSSVGFKVTFRVLFVLPKTMYDCVRSARNVIFQCNCLFDLYSTVPREHKKSLVIIDTLYFFGAGHTIAV